MNNTGGNSIPNIKLPSAPKMTSMSMGSSLPTAKPPPAPKMKQMPKLQFTSDVLKGSMKELQRTDIPDFKYLKPFEKQAIMRLL